MFMKWVIKITGDINKLRAEIDEVDKKIIELILKRMEIVHQVGLTKSKNKTRVYVPEREVAIYKRLSSFSNLSPKDIQSFYTEIISFCRKLEGILNVGVKADSISLLGVKKLFGEYVNPIFFNTFNELDLTSTKYILSKFSKDMLDFLLENNWHVINKTEIQGETLYLFSFYENSILKDDDIAVILSKEILSTNSIKIENNHYINFLSANMIEQVKDLDIKILVFIPYI